MFTSWKSTLAALTLGLLALSSGCSGTTANMTSGAPVLVNLKLNAKGQTSQVAESKAFSGSGYKLTPLLTTGDDLPLLEGTWPNLTPSASLTYAFPGVPDGTGVWQAPDGSYWVFCNHEIATGSKTNVSKTISGLIDGARLSLIHFDAQWRCLGAKSLVSEYRNANGVVGGLSITAAGAVQTGYHASRYCSSTLFTGYGPDPLYFPCPENAEGKLTVVQPDGTALVNDELSSEYEVACPTTFFTGKTVIMVGDDTTEAPMIMYIGKRTAGDPWGFLHGDWYAGQVFDGGTMLANSHGIAAGKNYAVRWLLIPASVYGSQEKFLAWARSAGNTTLFIRTEDWDQDPQHPGSFYWNTTGNDNAKGAPGSLENYDVYGNNWNLVFTNPADPLDPAGASLHLTVAGGPGSIISPDNCLVTTNGKLWMAEDLNGGIPTTQMGKEDRGNSVWCANTDGSGLRRVFQVDQKLWYGTDDAEDLKAKKITPWEYAGMSQVPGTQGTFILNVQAHSHNTADLWGGLQMFEGGQLLLATPQ